MRNSNRPVQRNGEPGIALAQLYERTNHRGRRYLIGRVGTAQLFVVQSDANSRGNPVWQAYLREGKFTPEDSTALLQDVIEAV